MDDCLIVLIVFCIIWLYLYTTDREGMRSRPSNKQLDQYTSDIIKNRELFINNSLRGVQREIPWVDPVIYEDIRLLAHRGGMTEQNVKKILIN